MSRLNIDLSGAPYYDDFDSDKQFYQILFVPKRAVQVREVNQLQTNVQEQFRRFGNHIFKDGSIVNGCNVTTMPKFSFVRLENVYNDVSANTAFNTSDLDGMLVVSPTTGLRASIRIASSGYRSLYPATNMIYVEYLNKGRDVGDNEVSTFVNGETIDLYDKTQNKFGTLNPGLLYNSINIITPDVGEDEVATGFAYGVTVGDGIVYQKGYFVKVLPHTILVNPYGVDVNDYLVGFETKEQIVTHLQDQSLIDPADTANRSGIGADRLKLEPVLVSKKREDLTDSDDFFPIIQFGIENQPVKQDTDPAYNKLGDVMSTRTYEESGDYYIKPFIVSAEVGKTPDKFQYRIDAGTGYIKGYRIQLLNSIFLNANRATDTGFNNSNIVTTNYGNYVLINELVGTFDADKLVEVTIYNTDQNSMSEVEGNTSAPTGTAIGTATIRAIIWDSGVKGTPTARYRAYISNIQMTSGYSFTNDAMSFAVVGGTYGNAKADIVLESTKAVIKDSGRKSLIFDTGVVGTKRLRDPSGANDTQFYFRDTSTATLQANGSVTFTLNTPHAGGIERFFSSPGALSNANELRVDISAGGAFAGPALTGTVNATSTTAGVLTGTGTAFLSQLKVGDTVVVGDTYYRQVINVNTNTQVTLNADISGGGGTATIKVAHLSGQILDLTAADTTVLSNTQFTVSLGYNISLGAPQTVVATYPVFRSSAVEIRKHARKNRYVKLDPATIGTTGPFNLGLVDVYQIQNVWIGNTYSESNPDRASWFILDNGQSEFDYDHSKLILKPSQIGKISPSDKILVKLSHFESDNISGIGFYSVDSYPVRGPLDVESNTNISYAEIPVIGGKFLRDSIDFRPQRFNTATSATIEADATVNPASANNSYNISSSGIYLSEPDTNFQADIEYYLPRYDLIQVNKDGNFTVKSSISASFPRIPVVDGDSMSIAVSYVPPFPSLVNDERPIFGSSNGIVSINLVGNRGYTMRDINTLDRRITRLEYYQTLSMLEAQAKDIVITDENGLDRFKNGIFADPLDSHVFGDVGNFEYNIAIDSDNSLARPKIEKNSLELDILSSNNVTVTNNLATLNYTRVKFIEQPYASKYRNCTESVWNWSGNLAMFPSYDYFRDEQTLPSVNATIDLASPWEDFIGPNYPADFGEWRTVATNRETSVSRSGSLETTTVTENRTQQRTVTTKSVETSQNTIDLGQYVTDFTISPYMRSREVAFIATGLKPSTKFYAFFDGKPVSQYCAPATPTNQYDPDTGQVTVTSGKESSVLNRTASYGTQLVSDSTGNVYGMFLIPEGIFKVGDRNFLIIDVDDIEIGIDASLSKAQFTYTATNMTVQSRSATLNVIEPTIKETSRVETITSRSVVSRETVDLNPEPPVDPLGQSINIPTPSEVPGIFLDAIGVFFRSKDPSLGATCYVTEMEAGVPNTNKIVAKSYLAASKINTSNNSSAETIFEFQDMPYLSSNNYYAFFVKPDGDSPEYQLWMSEIGGVDILTGYKIFSNPFIGVAFKSANSQSWDVLSEEDVKFNIYRRNFTALNGLIDFAEQEDEYIGIEGLSYANSNVSIQVGDTVYTAYANNVVKIGPSDPVAIIQSYDILNDKLVLDSSSGGFTNGTKIQIHRLPEQGNSATVSANTLIASSTIDSINDIGYSIVVPRIAAITPFTTNVTMQHKGISQLEVMDANWNEVQSEYEYEFIDQMRYVRSASNQSAHDKSILIRANLSTTNSYVSPVIDIRRKNVYVIKNLINDDLTDEETRYGNALSKYLSQPIVLADGQDAEDIKVYITAYRPEGTDINCYVKILSAEDPVVFTDKLWTKMVMTEGSSINSSSIDTNDYREFAYGFPTEEYLQGTAWCNASNLGIVQYRNADGAIFISYKTFAIKLVFTSNVEYRVPRVRDLRAIALQV